jgi:CBS domain-containing protein
MIKAEFYNIIKSAYPFDHLSEEQLEHLVSHAQFQKFAKNEFIFHEKESQEELDVYFLISGTAKNVLHRPSGKQVSLRYYYPGDLVGLMILWTSGDMSFSVQAIEECTLFRFNKKVFFDMLTNNKEFSQIILESVGNRMKTLYDEIKYKESQEESADLSLFRTRVNVLMDSPVTLSKEATMEEAAQRMLDEQVEALVVTDEEAALKGLVTQTDILRFLTSSRDAPSVTDWMNRKPYWVRDESFAYEALSLFRYEGAKYVPVLRNGIVVGLLTGLSFVNIHDSGYLDLSYSITSASSTDDLIPLSPIENSTFTSFISSLLEQDSFAYNVSEVLTNYNDRLYRKVIMLSEAEMIQEGFGSPPVNYCFIVMGSQGRSEQSFNTDQDNGIILSDYAHFDNAESVDSYFERFTEKINTKLTLCGFHECTGGIMAKELKWRKSYKEWLRAIDDWLHEIDAEEVQNFTMFYDFRPIFGDYSLAEDIRGYIAERAQKSLNLQQLLRKDAIRFRIPVNALGRINLKGRNKRFNIKKAGLMQIVNMVRIHSIKHGIKEVNTIQRLDALKENKVFHPRDAENAKTALHYLLYYRLNQNLSELAENRELTNELPVDQISKEDKRKLREALQIANRMQQVMEISFNRNRVV